MNPDKRFLFWQQWLYYTSFPFIAFGILLAVYGNNPLFEPYNKYLAGVFWHEPAIPGNADAFRAFVSGPLGGTLACCYILLAFIAKYPFRRKEVWARNVIVIAFGTWFILDSAVSLHDHAYVQVYLFNALSFLQKALPVAFTWREFK